MNNEEVLGIVPDMYNTQHSKLTILYCRSLATGVHAEYLFLTLLQC
jgi:hypothetical protein